MAGWILRTFESRDKLTMPTAWKTLALPIHDYCSQLWSTHKISDMQELESIQWSFLRKIKGFHFSDYWDAIRQLGMYSLECRRDRYQVLYCWKIAKNLVPSTGIVFYQSDRRGRLIKEKSVQQNIPAFVRQAKTNSFNIKVAKMLNCLPQTFRNHSGSSISQAKLALDNLLSTIDDEPHIP